MVMDFFKKRKAEKEELKRIREIISKIDEKSEMAKTSDKFSLINTECGKNMLKNAMVTSMDKKDSFNLECIYNLLTGWDEIGYMPRKLGEWLENLINSEDIEVGIHRTGGYEMIDPDNIYTSRTLYDIFSNGLYITGHISSGVDHNGKIVSLDKNISPLNNILDGVVLSKSSYKNSTGGVIIAIPKAYVTPTYELKAGHESDVYTTVDNQLTLKPKYLVGFIAQKDGVCKFYTKDDILNNYKDKSSIK